MYRNHTSVSLGLSALVGVGPIETYEFVGFGAMDVTKPYKFMSITPRRRDREVVGVW